MKHTTSFILFTLTAFLASLANAQQPGSNQHPNIVYIVADDLGWKDVGFNACIDIKTPNLDKLAAEGAKLRQVYVHRCLLRRAEFPVRAA